MNFDDYEVEKIAKMMINHGYGISRVATKMGLQKEGLYNIKSKILDKLNELGYFYISSGKGRGLHKKNETKILSKLWKSNKSA
jgi:hypothetical protein